MTVVVLIIAIWNGLFSDDVEIEQAENNRMKSMEASAESMESKKEVGINPGETAPDFELETLDGESVKLSDFRGQPVFLNFWATWCGPCRTELPAMQKLQENTDVHVLAVNLTKTELRKKHVQQFADAYQLDFPIALDIEGETADLYRINPIPTSYLLDSDGRIQHRAYGAMDYDSMVEHFQKME